MNWQGSPIATDRVFSSLAYLLPILKAAAFGGFIFAQFPIVQELYQLLAPLMIIYSIPGGGFILFLVLYLAVVNNPRVSRFIRFNVLQAILIGILLSLCALVLEYLLPLTPILVAQVLLNTIFCGSVAISVYGIVISAAGKYTELAQLSETAHLHIDRL